MAQDTSYVAFAAGYSTATDAAADYAAVESLYDELGMSDALDAVLVTHDEERNTSVVRHDAPRRSGQKPGPNLGLAAGVLVSVFPRGGQLGTVTADVARAIGHLTTEGLSRADLAELGEVLDENRAGLVIVAPIACSQGVGRQLSRASTVVHGAFEVDERALSEAIAHVS